MNTKIIQPRANVQTAPKKGAAVQPRFRFRNRAKAIRALLTEGWCISFRVFEEWHLSWFWYAVNGLKLPVTDFFFDAPCRKTYDEIASQGRDDYALAA